MREICLDTETTGIDPRDGHKIIEIACFEVFNKVKTGRFFHSYVNPQRDVPFEAFRIHGIATEFLLDKPVFGEIAADFLEFIGDDKLVIHNAAFDLKFLNYELAIIGKEPLDSKRAIDTLLLARKKFPGGQNSLDALCKRFGISLDERQKHGAKIDTELLCGVYLELCGGAQSNLTLDNTTNSSKNSNPGSANKRLSLATLNKADSTNLNELNSAKEASEISDLANKKPLKKLLAPRNFQLSDSELEAHQQFIIKNFKTNFWGYTKAP